MRATIDSSVEDVLGPRVSAENRRGACRLQSLKEMASRVESKSLGIYLQVATSSQSAQQPGPANLI